MLGNRVTGNEGLVLLCKLEIGIAEHRSGCLLDYPDPEALASYTRAVKVHKHCLYGPFGLYGLYGIIRGIAERGKHVCKSMIFPADEFYLAVARCINTLNAVFPYFIIAVRAVIKTFKSAVFIKYSKIGNTESHIIKPPE